MADKKLTVEDVTYRQYKDENDITILMKMIESELSEPYSIYTYRYFVQNWPELTYLAYIKNEIVGVVIGNFLFKNNKSSRRRYLFLTINKYFYREIRIT